MGNLFPHPSTPSVPMPPPAARPPTLGSSQVALAGINAKAAAAGAEGQGFDNTIKTSPEGTTAPATAKQTLLGR